MWLGLRDFLLIVPSSALIGVSAKRLYIIHGHAPSSFAPSRDQITECFAVPAEHICKIDLGHFLSRVARSAAPRCRAFLSRLESRRREVVAALERSRSVRDAPSGYGRSFRSAALVRRRAGPCRHQPP